MKKNKKFLLGYRFKNHGISSFLHLLQNLAKKRPSYRQFRGNGKITLLNVILYEKGYGSAGKQLV